MPALLLQLVGKTSVGGVFTDFADDAVAARVQFLLKTDPSYVRCLVNNRCAKRADG
jgi:glycerophosphoryl diester phosphodiesterase